MAALQMNLNISKCIGESLFVFFFRFRNRRDGEQIAPTKYKQTNKSRSRQYNGIFPHLPAASVHGFVCFALVLFLLRCYSLAKSNNFSFLHSHQNSLRTTTATTKKSTTETFVYFSIFSILKFTLPNCFFFFHTISAIKSSRQLIWRRRQQQQQ